MAGSAGQSQYRQILQDEADETQYVAGTGRYYQPHTRKALTHRWINPTHKKSGIRLIFYLPLFPSAKSIRNFSLFAARAIFPLEVFNIHFGPTTFTYLNAIAEFLVTCWRIASAIR